jgi:hypothetical protein
MWRRKPRITEDVYARLMTSFGRVVDLDPFVSRPAAALAQRVIREDPIAAAAVDAAEYGGAATYHLRLLAGAWVMANDGAVPRATAAAFEEAVAWRFAKTSRAATALPHRLSKLASCGVAGDLPS